jgi:transcriptional regulator with XRE-family HTH domain
MDVALDAHALRQLVWLRRLVVSGEARRIRIAAGISLSEAADAAGISVSTLWRWEAAPGARHRIPHGAPAVRYAAVLRALAEAAAS